jgi:para-aminobenzoate synthetase/4-amino-4-deoxychorismate lyase
VQGSDPSGPARPDPARGVFETLLVRDGAVQVLDLHVARLGASVGELYGARLPDDTAARVRSLGVGPSGDHRLRVTAIPDTDGIAIDVSSEPLSLPPPDRPLILTPALIPGGLGRHKWCDRRILDTFDPGNGVSLIVDQRDGEREGDEDVLEAAWANLWIVEGGRLVTPPTDGRILPGVTRAMLLELAPQIGLTAVEEPISLAQLRGAGAIFLTSSLRHAVPAALHGEHPEPHTPDIVKTIREALAKA